MIGDLLPAALGIAISPIPVIAVVVILATPRARVTGPTFALGWLLGLLAVATVASFLFDGAETEGSGPSVAATVLKVVAGALLLALGGKKWRTRPRPGETVEPPGWMRSMENASPTRALVVGATLAGANPKNLVLTMAAAASIAETGLEGTTTSAVVALFVLLSSFTVLGAVLFYLVASERAGIALASVRQFMTANTAVIGMVILFLLGAKLLGDGLSILFW